MGKIKTVQEATRDRINECINAVCDRFGSAVRPIYGSDDRRLATHIGSAILLKVHGTPLIITAAHVIDVNEQMALYVAGTKCLVPLRQLSLSRVARRAAGRTTDTISQ